MDVEGITIEFDYLPPSSNHSYLRAANGRMFMPKEAKQFKEMVGWLAKKYTPFDGDVEVEAWFEFPDKRRRDSQNLEKLLWDSLEGYCYHDDKQISDRHVHRIYGEKAHTRITIRRAE